MRLFSFFFVGEACNSAYCNNHGTCGFQFHRPVCTCGEYATNKH